MAVRILLVCIAVFNFTCRAARAQDDFAIEPRMNVNVGGIISAPLNPSARFVNVGWGMTFGGGYNFSWSHSLVGEFMWNKLYPTAGAVDPIKSTFQNPSIAAYTNLFALTANYRYEPHGRLHSMYFIGGGGWYHRNATVKQHPSIGSGVPCEPAWLWWGYSCNSGVVVAGLAPPRYTSNTLGVNGGFGFTFPLHEERGDRFYVETRYHYAPSRIFNTQVLDITLGFRY
ncbi:MAG TPA: hypothetical protein VGS27_02965 [Candidatus Sulfotelmatobacter sp.]|nr:hypothetical protein [Candidatus Sulfotelmatobacter sp.]